MKDALDSIHLPKMPKMHKPAFLKKKTKEESEKVKLLQHCFIIQFSSVKFYLKKKIVQQKAITIDCLPVWGTPY